MELMPLSSCSAAERVSTTCPSCQNTNRHCRKIQNTVGGLDRPVAAADHDRPRRKPARHNSSHVLDLDASELDASLLATHRSSVWNMHVFNTCIEHMH
jgi:hypothetical protein